MVAVAQCLPSGRLTNLGIAGQQTILPPGTYTGQYYVVGDLLLTNGSYTWQGATFYVAGYANKTPVLSGGFQRQVTGCTITVGANASLVVDNTTITASSNTATCPMWRGIVVNNNGQGPGGARCLVVQNNSTISHAFCGIDMLTSATAYYSINESAFAHNLIHVRDNAYHASGQVSLIARSTFESDASSMHFPYEQTPAGDQYYTYQALCITPRGDYASNAVRVRGNAIYQAVYGIVNNLSDRAGVEIKENELQKILQTGIWTVNNDTYSGTRLPVTSDNHVGMNSNVSVNTDQFDAASPFYGLVGEEPFMHNAFIGNSVIGGGGLRQQIGLSLTGETDVSGSVLQSLSEGVRTVAMDNGHVFSNATRDCESAIVVQDSGPRSYQVSIGCNTFQRDQSSAYLIGLNVQNRAAMNDQGDQNTPAANAYDKLDEAIRNNGSPFAYWFATSPQEAAVLTSTTGSQTTSLRQSTTPTGGWSGYCSAQGATNGNGVNRRTAGPSAGYIAALADSVRLRQVPPARRRAYLYQVLRYYRDQNQLSDLEAWWATLLLPNAEDYRTTGLTLLRAYDQQFAAAAAQRVLTGLQPQALLHAGLAAELSLRTVLRHLPQTAPQLAAADSVRLRLLAWSGTSVAARAARWLRYFHPRIALPLLSAAPLQPAQRALLPARPALALHGAVLETAYPNPAQAEVRFVYHLPAGVTAAELRLTDLLTGRVRRAVPLTPSKGEADAQAVVVRELPAGQYLCRLLVDGQPVAAPQRVVVLP